MVPRGVPLFRMPLVEREPARHITSVQGPPRFNKQTVDLDQFWATVVERFGGYKAVCENKLWASVARCMGASTGMTNASYSVRRLYERCLLPFERYKLMEIVPSPVKSWPARERGRFSSNTGGGVTDDRVEGIYRFSTRSRWTQWFIAPDTRGRAHLIRHFSPSWETGAVDEGPAQPLGQRDARVG